MCDLRDNERRIFDLNATLLNRCHQPERAIVRPAQDRSEQFNQFRPVDHGTLIMPATVALDCDIKAIRGPNPDEFSQASLGIE